MSDQNIPDAGANPRTSGMDQARVETRASQRRLPAPAAIQRVLAPVDGSLYAERSLIFAVSLARLAGVGITLAYVRTPYVEDTIPQRGRARAEPTDQGAVAETSDYPTYLFRLRREMLRQVPDVDIVIRDASSAGEGLLELEAKEPGAIVTLASHTYQGMERVLLGSVADEVVRRGRAPVLVVPPQVRVPSTASLPVLARVIVPLDGSLLAETALGPVLGLIAAHGASTREVEPLELTLLGIAPAQMTLSHTQQYLEQMRYLIEPTLPSGSVAIRTLAEVGSAPDAILAAADQGTTHRTGAYAPTAVLAMATHGRGGLGRFLFGSVAQEVLPRSPVPVLLVHPRAVDM